MNPIIEKITNEAGISAEQAEKVLQSVSGHLKEKLPYLLHNQIDNLLQGGTISDGMKQKFESLKDDFENSTKDFGTKAQEFGQEVGKKIGDIFKK
ncbi:MAG: hypothetical protein JSS90_03540 [Bacteroidetes bacterium]|jgi:uncharacterized protein (DUF2267 family)|nr:hypothetical protein [Bacteroidota bacterium]